VKINNQCIFISRIIIAFYFLIILFFCFSFIATALDPESLYKANFANLSSARLAVTLAFKKLARSPMEASKAIDQFAEFFCQKKLVFGSLEARGSALRGNTSAGTYTCLN
jgi:hypothetical protein